MVAQHAPLELMKELTFTGGSNDALPFWLSANQFGVIPSQKPSGQLRLAYTLPIASQRAISYNIGADVIGRASSNSTLFFQQLYGEIKWGPFLLRAGRKEETAGNVHAALSSGSMVLSNNAAPVTGISISWPEYVTVPRTGTFLAIKGVLKHGWVDGYRITTNPYLHSKSIFFRLGKDEWPVHIHAGLLHYAMWGGTHRKESFGKLPSSFNDYLRVFFFRGANSNIPISGEQTNALGNSLGAYDFSIIYTADQFKLHVYRQFYLEDTVSMRFRNLWDGLWGLGLSINKHPHWAEEVLWEVVNLKRQGAVRGEPTGTDNYYNHFVYSSGWTHRGRTLGTPLILMRPGQVGVFNNILHAQHFSISGSLSPATQYKLLFTYSRNHGANSIYRDREFGFTMENARFQEAMNQYAAGLSLKQIVGRDAKLSIFTRLAYDWGEVLANKNFGLTLGLTHRGGF